MLGGCATSDLPPAPKQATSSSYRYVIGPLDTVNIVVWRNPELTTSVPVRPDGRITTPLAEDVQAIGRSPSELARDIEKSLANFVRDPAVTVVVTGFQGHYNQQVRVIGEATRPAALPYRTGMTLLDAMIQVGGLTDFANGNGAVLVRPAEDKQYGVRLRDLIGRGDIKANVELLPGDVIIIPQSWF
ncbi:MAG TPA: XrtA/PEP-CTERM system exopolysaccharide export protein [Burkholderiaceae bacterium]|nr:XrtA/PEP-CTERM system exopolysaccharide export protein [Burkholderiaceae bacterium]